MPSINNTTTTTAMTTTMTTGTMNETLKRAISGRDAAEGALAEYKQAVEPQINELNLMRPELNTARERISELEASVARLTR
jgi:hypothetical protein